MRLISVTEYISALAVTNLEVAYLGLCLVLARYYPELLSKGRYCLLKVAFFVHPLVSAAFISAFFITRQRADTYLPSYVLFCAWALINGACLGAEIAYLWLFILPLKGARKFAVIASACVLIAAVLIAGLWSSVTTQRQWLWVFISLSSGALTLTGVFFTNDAASIHARYRRHWGYLTLPAVLGVVLGLVAAFVPAEKAPLLQHVQYGCQSMIGLLIAYLIQVLGAVSAHSSRTQAKETSRAPRWDGSSPQHVQSRQGLITDCMSLEDISTADLESLVRDGDLDGSEKSEGCEPRPDSLTLPGTI
ncbi:hypothetical protein ARSEF4850_006097 [Beauveria asiatica]